MFTGLIEEIGIVKSIHQSGKSATLVVGASRVLGDVKRGDSISTNGVCLTVTQFNSNEFTVDVMPETMKRSNLGKLKSGSKVNLERAMKVGDRFDGHIVSGHIDGTGIIKSFEEDDNAIWVSVSCENELLKYIIEKGSIAIDGISLTVAYVDDKTFEVSIIPMTKDDTTLISKKIGDKINLECDIVGKYVEKLMGFSEKEKGKSRMSAEFLRENGFY